MLIKEKKGSGIILDTHQEDKTIELVVGVDAGSTQTRVSLADKQDAKEFLSEDITKEVFEKLDGDMFIIPSTYAEVLDEREIKPKSKFIEDNYDSRIIRISTGAEKPLVGSVRVIRGQKIEDATGLTSRFLDSSTNKMDNTIFYVNVLDGIGYAILQKYNGKVPTKVKIHLILSVRPKERSSICTAKMDENFIGEYIFRYGTTAVTMNIVTTEYTTEPEAQIFGASALLDVQAALTGDEHTADLADKFAYSDSYMHIEGGGSSIGVEVVRKGHIIDSCSQMFKLGGNYLTRIAVERLQDTKGRQISEESVREAIETCLLRNGREREDVSDIISQCKNIVARNIAESLRHDVIDVTSDFVLSNLDFVTLGGRLFNKDASGVSVAQYLTEYIHQISPHTEVIVLDKNRIPQGNLIMGLNNVDFDDDSSTDDLVIEDAESEVEVVDNDTSFQTSTLSAESDVAI